MENAIKTNQRFLVHILLLLLFVDFFFRNNLSAQDRSKAVQKPLHNTGHVCIHIKCLPTTRATCPLIYYALKNVYLF